MTEDYDNDLPPIPPERLARMKQVALAKFIRHKLGMSREQFATVYGIPLKTLCAWERHEAEPTPTELIYLRLIERQPNIAELVAAE